MTDFGAMRRRNRKDYGGHLGCGCLVLVTLGFIAVWGGVIYAVVHFVLKYW